MLKLKTKLKIKNFIPQNIGNNPVHIKENKHHIIIHYKASGHPKPITIKKEIFLNKSFFEIIGLYYGDGINTRKGNKQTGLANSCPELHKKWIKFLEVFGINKPSLRAKIQIGEYNIIEKNKLFEYWIKNTGLSIENMIPNISIKKNNKTKEHGLLVTTFNSKIFRLIFNRIFDYSLNLIKSNKIFAAHFIRGLFAAEGHIGKKKKGSLNYLEIPIKDIERRKYVKRLLDKVCIRMIDQYERLNICGYFNFETFKRLQLHSLHPDKNSKFKKAFSCLLRNRPSGMNKLKIIKVLQKSSGLTRYQISKIVNIGISGVHKSLRDLEIKGIVTRSRKFLYKDKKYTGDVWSLIKIPENPYLLTTSDYCKK